jgi:diguanylate cyclase (GGDEF)-like protein
VTNDDQQGGGHHFGGTYTRALMTHLRQQLGPDGLARVLSRAGESRSVEELSDLATWSSYDEFRALLTEGARALGGAPALTAVGRELLDLSELELNPATTQAMGSPEAIYADAATMGAMICPILGLQSVEIAEREWLITQEFRQGFVPFEEHCSFQVGVQQFSTMLFGYPPAHVVEEQCACRGAAACVFRIRWDSEDELERRTGFLEGRVRSLEALLDQFESTIGDLISGPDLQTILTRTLAAAGRAVLAPIWMLALEDTPAGIQRIYSSGVTESQEGQIADDLLASPGQLLGGEQLVVEVASRRSRFGCLAAIRPGAAFTPMEASRLQAYASFLAAALDSASTVAEAHRLEEEARRQGDTARALLSLSTGLAEATTLEEMAAQLVRTVPAVMGCERALVILPEETGTEARIVATYGYPTDVDRTMRSQPVPIPPLTQTGPEFTILEEADQESLIAIMMTEAGTTANIVIPIVLDGQWAGAIAASVVHNPERLRDSAENEERLRGLAGLAATAIRNARLLEQVRHQALHDPLTGLPNRSLILDRVSQMLGRARRNKQAAAVLFIDLDGFKEINDTFGHAVGDELLRGVTSRLTGMLRPSDTVGRLGGDEFVVLVDGASLDVGPELVAERILSVLREPFDSSDESVGPLRVTASIGIVVGDNGTPGDLLCDADVALYQAKAAGKDCYRIFEVQMQTLIQDRLLLQMDLRGALARRQFALVYQPICNLATGAVTGAEALLRWEHPVHGQIQPDEFISLLEQSGLILDVGRWVLEEACNQAAHWRAQGLPVDIAVNVSGQQLEAARFLADVRGALSSSGLLPAALIIEITESTMMTDVTAVAQRLRAVKELGVRIAIDDFGTGYSSLAVLKDFTVDILKIDRAFVSGLGNSGEAAALIRTLVQLGKTLGLSTLAEGIEEPSQYAALEGQDCDSGQGFFIARPMPADDLASFFLAAKIPQPASTPDREASGALPVR